MDVNAPGRAVGRFGHPCHVRNGFDPADVRFVHPIYGIDPETPPHRLRLRQDLVTPLTRRLTDPEDSGIIFVDASVGVEIEVAPLEEDVVRRAVASFRKSGQYRRMEGRHWYALEQGITDALVFQTSRRMAVVRSVELAAAWSIAANRGHLFLQAGAPILDFRQFILTP